MTKQPQQKRSQETRKRILESAITCLASFGYTDFSTQRVASYAKLSKGALFQHFPTKVMLVAATVDFYFSQLRAKEFDESITTLPLRDRVELFVNYCWEAMTTAEYIGCSEVWSASRTDKKLQEALESYIREDQDIIDILAIIPEYAKHSSVSHINSTLLSSLEGAALDYVCTGSRENKSLYLEYLIGLTMRELESGF